MTVSDLLEIKIIRIDQSRPESIKCTSDVGSLRKNLFCIKFKLICQVSTAKKQLLTTLGDNKFIKISNNQTVDLFLGKRLVAGALKGPALSIRGTELARKVNWHAAIC
jgi:hypothetical protein